MTNLLGTMLNYSCSLPDKKRARKRHCVTMSARNTARPPQRKTLSMTRAQLVMHDSKWNTFTHKATCIGKPLYIISQLAYEKAPQNLFGEAMLNLTSGSFP